MTRRYVNQLSHGDAVDETFLVADKQLRANRQGNLYLHLELRDKSGSVGARLWNATEDLARTFEPGDFIRVRGKTQVFQGSLQIILTHVDPIDSARVEPEDYLPQCSQNITKLVARLREVLFSMQNPHLRALIECFLIDEAFFRKLTAAPAGIKNHHAYQGGLLEHIVTLLNLADRIKAKAKLSITFSVSQHASLDDLCLIIGQSLRIATGVLTSSDVEGAKRLVEQKDAFRTLEHRIIEEHFRETGKAKGASLRKSALFVDIIRDLHRVNSHIVSAAYPIVEAAGLLRDSRIKPE